MVTENNRSGMASGANNNIPGSNSGATNKKRNPVPKMVPLLSRRSVIVLAIGVAIGIFGGLLYYFASPSFSSLDTLEPKDTSPIIWGNYEGPYESTVQIQVVNPGSSYTALTDLRRAAEYYAAKANTFSFIDYLSQKLVENAPEYSHTTDELKQMISIRYNSNEEVPVIEITTIGADIDETLYLTAFVPMVFKDFLASEEEELRLQEYDSLLEDIDDVKQDLLEAEKELADFSLENVTSDLENDATYISLTATVAALQTELSSQAIQLATLVAVGDNNEAYLDAVAAVEVTSVALAEAKSELAILEAQYNIDYTEEDLAYQIAQARVDNLSRELASLTDRATSVLTGYSDESTALEYMVAGTPTTPIPSIDRIRGRDAVLLGGILGICVAWVLLNFKWIAKGMPSATTRREEETA